MYIQHSTKLIYWLACLLLACPLSASPDASSEHELIQEVKKATQSSELLSISQKAEAYKLIDRGGIEIDPISLGASYHEDLPPDSADAFLRELRLLLLLNESHNNIGRIETLVTHAPSHIGIFCVVHVSIHYADSFDERYLPIIGRLLESTIAFEDTASKVEKSESRETATLLISLALSISADQSTPMLLSALNNNSHDRSSVFSWVALVLSKSEKSSLPLAKWYVSQYGLKTGQEAQLLLTYLQSNLTDDEFKSLISNYFIEAQESFAVIEDFLDSN